MWLWAKFKGVVSLACQKIMWYIGANQHFSPLEGLSWAGFLNPAHCYINYKIQCLLETFHFFVQDKLWFSSLFGSNYFNCKNCKFSVFCNCWDKLIHSSEDHPFQRLIKSAISNQRKSHVTSTVERSSVQDLCPSPSGALPAANRKYTTPVRQLMSNTEMITIRPNKHPPTPVP